MSYFSICQELQDRRLDATPRNFMDVIRSIVTEMSKVLVSED